MRNEFEINFDALAKRDSGLIKEVKKNLFITDSEKAGLIISRVLHTIRRSLTFAESAEFISRLPDYLKVIYVTKWKASEEKIQLKHLDEFTEEALRLDHESAVKVFHKEIDALTAVITVLKALNRHVNLLSFPSFSYSLKRELHETMLEPAA